MLIFFACYFVGAGSLTMLASALATAALSDFRTRWAREAPGLWRNRAPGETRRSFAPDPT